MNILVICHPRVGGDPEIFLLTGFPPTREWREEEQACNTCDCKPAEYKQAF